jgi:hypothetical protein
VCSTNGLKLVLGFAPMHQIDYLSFGVPMFLAAVSLAWNVAVIVLLVKIWQKVRHLPG